MSGRTEGIKQHQAVLIIKTHRWASVFERTHPLYGCSACSKSISSFLTPSEFFTAWARRKTAWNINIMCCMVKANQMDESAHSNLYSPVKMIKYWGRASWEVATGGDLWWPFYHNDLTSGIFVSTLLELTDDLIHPGKTIDQVWCPWGRCTLEILPWIGHFTWDTRQKYLLNKVSKKTYTINIMMWSLKLSESKKVYTLLCGHLFCSGQRKRWLIRGQI